VEGRKFWEEKQRRHLEATLRARASQAVKPEVEVQEGEGA
jgi:hypothetical protein